MQSRHLFYMSEGVSFMNLLIVIFGLVTVLAIIGTYQAIKEKNLLSVLFNFGTFAVFGFFTVMTVINQGYPPSLH